MTSAGLIWANLRRRPARTLLTVAAITVAFALHGLALGIVEGFRRAALEHGVAMQAGAAAVAIGVTAIGMLLVLVLVGVSMAHATRARASELALLKALGFPYRRIVLLLVAEMAVPCFAGAALGLAAGKSVFATLVTMLPALAVVPAPLYTAPLLASAAVIAALLAIVCGILPSRRMARENVITLMRAVAPTATMTSAPGGAPDTAAVRDSMEVRSNRATRSHRLPDLRLPTQIAVATRIGLSTLPLRAKGALLIVASSAAVVFLLLIPLTIAESIRVALTSGADPARVVVRSRATVLLHDSRTPDTVAALLADAPGVAVASDGEPLIQNEVHMWPRGLVKRNDSKGGYSILVGVGPSWTQMTPSFRLLSGRLPHPGSREIIAGTLAAAKFSSLDAGTLQVGDERWRVVGTFSTGGWWDGYLVGDAADIKAIAPASAGSAVRLRLRSPQAFEAFQHAVAPRLPPGIVVERETDHYAGFWRRVPKHLVYIAFILAALIGAGAALGSTLVMESALEDRRREIATLRLLGFDARAVAASLVLEGIALSVCGALVGLAGVFLAMDGRIVNGAWGVSRLGVDEILVLIAVGWGGAIGVAGTSVLAVRMLRSTVLEALQDLIAMGRHWLGNAFRRRRIVRTAL